MTDFRAGTLAVIFDLDGVIVDSEPLHKESFQRLFAELNLTSDLFNHWEQFIGRSDREALVEMLDGRMVAASIDELLDRKADLFLELLRVNEPLFPEIPELVADLESRYRLAIASGSLRSAIAAVLELRGLRRHFPVAVSVQDVARSKPAPDLYQSAAALLGVDPAACVVIEDSVAGVTAARAAGMRVIGITNSTTPDRLHAAQAVVRHYSEVRALLL
jgi:HAD superfamily hydrolase (TIGR01509 family)